MNKQKSTARFIFISMLFLIFSLMLIGCKKTTYKVNFYVDDTIYLSELLKKGEKVQLATPPLKEGYQFVEWQVNGEKFDESTKINSNLDIKAKFLKKEYQVTFILRKENADDFSEKYVEIIEHGELLEKKEVEVEEGFEFNGWYVEQMGGELFSFDTAITDSIELVGRIEQKKYQVDFKTNCDETIASQVLNYNELVESPLLSPRNGYIFLGWYLNDTIYDFNQNVKNSMTLEAKWEMEKYTVQFITNSIENIESQIVNYQEYANIPKPIYKEGFQFLGWYLGDVLYDFSMPVAKDITLEAKWSVKKCVINFVNHTGTIMRSQKVEYAELLKKPSDPYREGYNFLGWYLDDTLYTFNTPVTSDLRLVAKWEPRTYRVRFRTNFEMNIEDQIINYGEKIILENSLVRPGYEFLGWYEYDKPFDLDTAITQPHTLTAKWDMSKALLQEYLTGYIDTITKEELYLPTTLDDLNGTILWESSNEEIISSSGKVKRLTYDVNVKLKAIIEKENEIFELEFTTMVEKIELKPVIKGKIVSGYLYFGGGDSPLSEKAIEQLDIINYSFGEIKDGKVYLPSPDAAKEVLKYRQSGVRVILALGGWGAGGFSESLISAESRTKFIDSIMNLIKEYQFDGIDIDWEYPTSSVAGIGSNPNDKNNLTLFCQEMKEKMKLYRDDLLLTIAVTTSDSFYDFQKLNAYIDLFNVMTYDFAMGNKANHDSPLYSSSYGSGSMDKAVSFMKARVDSNKIVPGAAFYCRNGKFSSSQVLGASLSTSMGTGAISFKKLKEMMLKDSTFIENYDVSAGAAYTIYNGTFYSYDNERSVAEKCEYVKSNQLGGLMCWDLSQDYVSNEGISVLVNTMYVTLKKEN